MDRCGRHTPGMTDKPFRAGPVRFRGKARGRTVRGGPSLLVVWKVAHIVRFKTSALSITLWNARPAASSRKPRTDMENIGIEVTPSGALHIKSGSLIVAELDPLRTFIIAADVIAKQARVAQAQLSAQAPPLLTKVGN